MDNNLYDHFQLAVEAAGATGRGWKQQRRELGGGKGLSADGDGTAAYDRWLNCGLAWLATAGKGGRVRVFV